MAFAVEQQPASPAGPEERPGFIARGRIRRRIRFLRKARELAYRDLGGLVFNLHRFGQRNDALVLAKLTTLGHIDSELRALEDQPARAPADDGAERGGDHRLRTLRRDPLQRGPLLPQLRPAAAPPRRPARRPPQRAPRPRRPPGRARPAPAAPSAFQRTPRRARAAGAEARADRRGGSPAATPAAARRRRRSAAAHRRSQLAATPAGGSPPPATPAGGHARGRHAGAGGRTAGARGAGARERAGRRRSHGDRAPAREPAVSWPGQPAAASATPAGAEPSVSAGELAPGPPERRRAEACPLCGVTAADATRTGACAAARRPTPACRRPPTGRPRWRSRSWSPRCCSGSSRPRS